MLNTLAFALIALTAWATLIWCGWQAARDWRDQLNARRLSGLDGFTPSMARWGYVGERRGASR